METKDLRWLAGLLEGEGCFSYRRKCGTPLIDLTMTDEDVVRRVSLLFQRSTGGPKPSRAGKPLWSTRVSGSDAAAMMMTLYSLMGIRRRSQIREALSAWMKQPRSRYRVLAA